ncbi:hypothetical protein AAC387_Pa04g2589 [Persea americana]
MSTLEETDLKSDFGRRRSARNESVGSNGSQIGLRIVKILRKQFSAFDLVKSAFDRTGADILLTSAELTSGLHCVDRVSMTRPDLQNRPKRKSGLLQTGRAYLGWTQPVKQTQKLGSSSSSVVLQLDCCKHQRRRRFSLLLRLTQRRRRRRLWQCPTTPYCPRRRGGAQPKETQTAAFSGFLLLFRFRRQRLWLPSSPTMLGERRWTMAAILAGLLQIRAEDRIFFKRLSSLFFSFRLSFNLVSPTKTLDLEFSILLLEGIDRKHLWI